MMSTKRKEMNRITLRDFLIGVCCIPLLGQAQQRPNVIVFMVDDMGWQDTSYPFYKEVTAFNTYYETPHMVQLAKEGVAFTDAYATPVCTPSRASLMSGMNASRHGITNWTSPFKDRPTDAADLTFNRPEWNYNGLSPVKNINNTAVATTLPQLLKDNGYFTIHVGKAHWASAGTPGSNPYSMGFVVNVSGTSTGRPASYHGRDNFGRLTTDYHGTENLQEYFGQDIFLTEAITQEALKTLDFPIAQKQPFFLNLCHYALHDPLMPDPRFYQKYVDKGLSEQEAKYASMIEGMDKSLGDVMTYLDKKGVANNTYIIFISDNGGLTLPPSRGGKAYTHNKPLRSGKGSIYEGGIRVPLIIKGPHVQQVGRRVGEPVIIEDLFPTILEMTQTTGEIQQIVDGESMVPLLKNRKTVDQNRSLIFHIPNKWTANDGDGFNFRSAIRKGDFKLVKNIRDQSLELYHLADDIGERNNLIDNRKYNKIKQELISELERILTNNSAPMPVRK